MSRAAILALVIVGCATMVAVTLVWFRGFIHGVRAQMRIDQEVALYRVHVTHCMSHPVLERPVMTGFRWHRKCDLCGASQVVDEAGASTDFRLIDPCVHAERPPRNEGGGYHQPDGTISKDPEGRDVIGEKK